jgi:isoamylase
LRPDGEGMTNKEWNIYHARCLGLLLHGDAIEEQDERGDRIHDDTYLFLLNANAEPIAFRMPGHVGPARWRVEIDTCYADGKRPDLSTFNTGESYAWQGRSATLLRIMKTSR